MIFYYGTTSKNLKDIKVKGLKKPSITDNIDLAFFYAEEAVEKLGGVITVFQIKMSLDDLKPKENQKFKYPGIIEPSLIKMIEGPENKENITSEEVIALVSRYHTSPEDFSKGLTDIILKYQNYKLVNVNISLLSNKKIDKDLVNEYINLNLDECPPIILHNENDDYKIVDGKHRVETFRKAKRKTILAYVPE